MIAVAIIVGLVVFVWAVIAAVRIEMVYKYLDRRIDEVYASPNWYKYDIDISGTYNKAFWDYRKWKYEDFFPEAVE
jgi:hypothetical protein